MRFLSIEVRSGIVGFAAPTFMLCDFVRRGLALAAKAGQRSVGISLGPSHQSVIVTSGDVVAQCPLREVFFPLPQESFTEHSADRGVIMIQHTTCLNQEVLAAVTLGGGLASPLVVTVAEREASEGFLVTLVCSYETIPVLDCCHLNGKQGW